MLTHYLHNAIKDIENLIELTHKDIADIKVAKHSEVFERAKIKNDLIQSFETKKSLLDNELMKMLILHENDLMPRELALTKIWRDDNYFTSRSMDVYIAKLRKYLKPDEDVEILNIHGEGFRLVVKSSTTA
jgi:DNA-binding response OmpR family regulator